MINIACDNGKKFVLRQICVCVLNAIIILIKFICSQCVEVEQKRMQSCILFMNLKKLNRLAHIRLKRGRDQTNEVNPKRSYTNYKTGLCPFTVWGFLLFIVSEFWRLFQAKQRVDVLHLQLQNLLYEVLHLQKEISKCLEFKLVQHIVQKCCICGCNKSSASMQNEQERNLCIV